VLEHLDGFREEASFSTWVHRIATFAALKVLRKRRGLETVPLEVPVDDSANGGSLPRPDYIADWSMNPEELASRNEVRGLIESALERLDEKHRLVFVLRDIQGFTVRETSESLGISEANVKVRLLRARLQLREQLTRVFGDPDRVLRRGDHRHPEPNEAAMKASGGAAARGV
jgi:RNA polymerase sigma-70 factor (ECF subfamily)